MTPRRVDPVAEPATLEAMDQVMQQAYGVASFRMSIERFVAAQPDGLVVVEQRGRVVGAGCCIAYPDGGFGWIGLVATLPSFQRRGIATAITEMLSTTLAGHGAASVLDASAAGAPVYERMGFADHGSTLVMTDTMGEASVRRTECESLTHDDVDDVVAFDAGCFGADRRTLLTKVLAQHPGRSLVVRRDGRVRGYLVAQQTTLAPVVADDDASLADLVEAARRLEWSSPPRINVPPKSRHVASLLHLGFETNRALRHMRRGIDTLPGQRQSIAGLVSLGEG